MLAIVAGIGGAFGFSATQDPCEEENHIGYTYNGAGMPTEPPEDQENLTELGRLDLDFECDEAPDICHWVYVEEEGEQSKWVPCEGELAQ
ncbi:hypothetical protein [Parapedobacter sp. 10938]|uniref:hypothetical protein n=1 Tax=Parapedobacter flavus TaxID=3110225 RepID=UPI002DB58F22|nr:hypothetical protein [Parapedobacter sp. 10938]MEC3879324.1 hypothetical protein [Parapedobacter sp. 10938]